MALLTVRTAKVVGGGSVTCRYCSRKTTFKSSEWLEFVDDGTTLSCLAVHDGLVVLHDCHRKVEMVWVCPACGYDEGEPRTMRTRSGKHRHVTKCQRCYQADLVQVKRGLTED